MEEMEDFLKARPILRRNQIMLERMLHVVLMVVGDVKVKRLETLYIKIVVIKLLVAKRLLKFNSRDET
ncbi:hypothetical protein BACI348_40324 [Bacillus altitudinis]|uniref:Uncharacterized protein n=1 Tax=Bacillus altitudinis TaxID=293387 RepID=A0A653PB16_BACAB|nr:hypothetical protein BACI348_40324 [Bacillus altitudinis]